MTLSKLQQEGRDKILVYLKCDGCNQEINRTKDLETIELAEKIFDDALFNPMIGWCNKCNRKPFPFIEFNGKVVKQVGDNQALSQVKEVIKKLKEQK